LSTSRLIITNFHVVNGTDQSAIRLSDRRVTEGTLSADAMTDIAVLKIDLDNLDPGRWADSDNSKSAISCGHSAALRLDRSLSSASSAQGPSNSSNISRSPIRNTCRPIAVNPGNSGGPLVNIERPNHRHQCGISAQPIRH